MSREDHMTIISGASPLLQSGDAVGSGATYVASTPATVLWGRLPARDDAPIATIAAGDMVVIDTVSHEGIMDDQGSDPVAYFRRVGGVTRDGVLDDTVAIAAEVVRTDADGPHVVTGPIRIDGAHVGDLLAITVERLELRAPYGVISTRHGKGVLNGDRSLDGSYGAFCRVVDVDGVPSARIALTEDVDGLDVPDATHATFPLDPFLGVIGVAADVPGRPHSTPPGLHGGNIDIARLTAGSTLFLPVQVDGALLYVGDPHFAQGDGEVALTALEAPLRATLRVDVVPAAEAAVASRVSGPFAVAQGELISVGLSEDLDLALRRGVRNAVELLRSLVVVDERRAYLYLSAAADFAVSQAVDIVKGVHGAIRLTDFDRFRDTPFARRITGIAAEQRSAPSSSSGSSSTESSSSGSSSSEPR